MINNVSGLRILGIAGSLRERSSSQFALEHAMSVLNEKGCCTRAIDLRSANLPFCNGNPDEQALTYPAVAELRKAVSEAHALVLVTPEYHGGISGVLKNALDLLDTRQLAGKVAGVVSVLGGAANANAWHDLSQIMRCCHAWIIPRYVAIGRASTLFVNGRISDVELRLRFDQFTTDLVSSTVRLCALDQAALESRAVNLSSAAAAQSASS